MSIVKPASRKIADPGTGIVTAEWEQKLSALFDVAPGPSINILNYGADPSGVIASDTAFSNAVAAAQSGRIKTIYLPAGTYKLTGAIACGAYGIRWVGDGPNSTIITAASPGFTYLSWSGSSFDGGVFGIKFLATGTPTAGNFISGTSVQRFSVVDCVLGNGYNGIYLEDYNGVSIERCTFSGLIGSYAIKSYGTASGNVNVLDLDNVKIGFSSNSSSDPDAILLDGYFATVDFRHVAIVKGNRGLACTNSNSLTGAIHIELSAYDFQVDAPYAACVFMDPGSAVSRGHKFTDAYFHASQSTHNVDLAANVQSCKFGGGECTGADKAGFNCSGDFPDITGFQITTNGQSGSGTYPGVLIKSTCTGARVVGNLAGAWSGFGTETQSYGVDIESGASNYTVLGNNLRGNVTGDYRDSSNDANSVIGPNVGVNTSKFKVGQDLQFTGSGNFATNGSVATAMSSVGPTGAHTAIQKWLTVYDSSGNPFYIPCW